MSSFSYVAVDPAGSETRGTLEVSDQSEALRRIREMGLFPTRILAERKPMARAAANPGKPHRVGSWQLTRQRGVSRRIRAGHLSVLTRQLATLIESGMPLLRSLRTLQEQVENRRLRQVLDDLSVAIENGSSFAEALAQHPKVFNRLYVNMVRAGEVGGALELSLKRLAEFMEKAQRIKGKVKAALYYPCAVLVVATGILALLLTFIVPRFRAMFEGLSNGAPLPAFSVFVFKLSDLCRTHALLAFMLLGGLAVLVAGCLHTTWGRWSADRLKLSMPVLGALFQKAALARFARTFGTLMGSGVPILQALTIVRETAGNMLLAKVIGQVHDAVKEGDPIAPTLKQSGLFPVMVAGMVDVGEQTGALPDMLMKIADTADEEVDNAAAGLTSLLEPVMILILAVIVGSIVVAIFLPLLHIDPSPQPERDG